MTQPAQHLFWDSCVFTAYLAEEHAIYDTDSIDQFLAEAKDGKWVIHTSTFASAEVLPSQIKKAGIGTFEEFLEDFTGAIVAMDPNPNVMSLSGQLRDLPYAKSGGRRRLTTVDAVMLASAIHLQDAYGLTLHKFHTFDKGGKKGPEGSSVPLIGYETWCDGFAPAQAAIAARVIALDRAFPVHPTPTFKGVR